MNVSKKELLKSIENHAHSYQHEQDDIKRSELKGRILELFKIIADFDGTHYNYGDISIEQLQDTSKLGWFK